jgi:hypothetical protein
VAGTETSASLGIPTSIPKGNWGVGLALGLPSDACEFGPCGGGASSFQSVAAAAPVPAVVCAVAEPCGVIAAGATAVVLGSIVAYQNRDEFGYYFTAEAKAIQAMQSDRCQIVRQKAIASCSALFIGEGNNDSNSLTRACVRIKMTAQVCFNY